jgi:hypothetical protein
MIPHEQDGVAMLDMFHVEHAQAYRSNSRHRRPDAPLRKDCQATLKRFDEAVRAGPFQWRHHCRRLGWTLRAAEEHKSTAWRKKRLKGRQHPGFRSNCA